MAVQHNLKALKISSIFCHHRKDFDLNAEWIFFATSHGKSPSDGIGCIVKSVVSRKAITSNYWLDFGC